MLWGEFVAGLDAIRAEIRSSRGLKAPCPATDPIYDKIHALLTAAFAPTRSVQVAYQVQVPVVDADLLAIAPVEENPVERTPEPKVVYEADVEGGKMKVLARETKRVQRPADIVEVTEKELAK